MTRAAPYVIPWAGETILPMPLRVDSSSVFYDDARADRRYRDDDEALLEVWGGHQSGPRVYRQLHPLRQREAMRNLRCATRNEHHAHRDEAGMLWLLPLLLLDGSPAEGTTWEGVHTTIPPSCVPCAERVAMGIPWMRDSHVRLRARIAEQTGVRGTLHPHPEQPGPAQDDVLVGYDSPDTRYVVAWHAVCALEQVTVEALITPLPLSPGLPIRRHGPRERHDRMTAAFPHHTDESGQDAASAALAVRDLDLALDTVRPTCAYHVQQRSDGGAQVSINYVAAPDDELPAVWAWALGDVKTSLAQRGIRTQECQRVPHPCLGLDISLPTLGDVHRFTALIESGMTELELAALHLTRALYGAGIEIHVAADDEDLRPLSIGAGDALTLWKLLRGLHPDQSSGIDISTLSGLDRLADDLTLALDADLVVLIEAKAACDNCGMVDRIEIGALAADDAHALAAVISRLGDAQAQPTTAPGGDRA